MIKSMFPKCVLLVLVLIACTTGYCQKNISLKQNFKNPLVPGYFADPSILHANGKYYIYATIDPWGGDSIACFVSNNLKNWKRVALNWPTKQQCTSPESNANKVWAPSVVYGSDKRFHMFVSVGSEIYAGVSNRPEGPWRNVVAGGGPFVHTQKSIGVHTIDAEAFVDNNGKSYLYWGSGLDWKNGHCYAAALNNSMDAFITQPKDITPPHYFEAPYMLKYNNKYYLMYSDGKCTDTSYKVRYSVGDTPFGPWKEGVNSPILSTNMQKHIWGPGHHTILMLNGKYYIIYHRIANLKNKDLLRQLCIDRLTFDQKGNIHKVDATH